MHAYLPGADDGGMAFSICCRLFSHFKTSRIQHVIGIIFCQDNNYVQSISLIQILIHYNLGSLGKRIAIGIVNLSFVFKLKSHLILVIT